MAKKSLGKLYLSARVRDRDALSRLRKAGGAVSREIVLPAVKRAVAALADACKARIPADSGVARDSLVSTVHVGASGIALGAVFYDAAKVKANARNHFFYAAAIEFGADNRPAVAPLATAAAVDWPPIDAALRAEIAAGLRALSA